VREAKVTGAGYWIEKLDLEPHPEGGYFRETYRAAEEVSLGRGRRSVCTAVYYLLSGKEVSVFHRLRSDEIWHAYAGVPVRIHTIDRYGVHQALVLGTHADPEMEPQTLVAKGCWFGAELLDATGFALVGATVAPGFDYADFEIAERSMLLERYPEHAEIIARLTRSEESSAG
jgi:predicted cupin superfamily sugar epimerase